MYLLDTNIWLERLLDQEKSEIVGKFLDIVPSEMLFITDFSFHSIGVILCRLKKRDVLTQFTDDIFINGEVSLLSLEPEDIIDSVEVIEKYNLDFDDAYQYITAKKNNLILVSFDSDFIKTERSRKTPEMILANYTVKFDSSE